MTEKLDTDQTESTDEKQAKPPKQRSVLPWVLAFLPVIALLAFLFKGEDHHTDMAGHTEEISVGDERPGVYRPAVVAREPVQQEPEEPIAPEPTVDEPVVDPIPASVPPDDAPPDDAPPDDAPVESPSNEVPVNF